MTIAGRPVALGWIVAADLVPWWFAVAFWISLLILVAIVVRDIRRVGGPRALWSAVQRATEEWAAERRRDDPDEGGPPDDDGGHHPS